MLLKSKSSIFSSFIVGNCKLVDNSPANANFIISDLSKPLAGPRLHRSDPCFANASLNFLICNIAPKLYINTYYQVIMEYIEQKKKKLTVALVQLKLHRRPSEPL